MHRILLPRFFRFVIYPLLATVLLLSLILSYGIVGESMRWKAHYGIIESENQRYLVEIGFLKVQTATLYELTAQIDPQLPQLSTTELDLLFSSFEDALTNHEYERAHFVLSQNITATKDVLAHQDEIAKSEVERLKTVLSSNIVEISTMFGNTEVVRADSALILNNETIPIMTRLSNAREWIMLSAHEVKRRRGVMDTAQKQIVIVKSEKSLNLYENGEKIYSMPVSLGRPSAVTRTGDFAILDKLGTVWSFWQIWLPYWMGIYFAGSSENGIHGLPFDNYGNVYWRAQIGNQNITYGCVMPDNPDMIKLYEWAEVGVPVAIID